MKVSCDVIQDLLPLYTDQAASADTVALVEEHLASCPACREELGRLGTALPAEPEEMCIRDRPHTTRNADKRQARRQKSAVFIEKLHICMETGIEKFAPCMV